MIKRITFLFIFLLKTIKGIEELEYKDKLNDFLTISKDQIISIKTEKDSMVYFDSIDKRSLVYNEDGRIDGDFYLIPKDQEY